MKQSNNQFYIFYSVMLISFVSFYFTDIEIFGHIASIFVLISIFISWFHASKTFKIISIIFFAVAFIFVLTSEQSFFDLYTYTLSNVPLILFFSMMPWISMIFQIGGMKDSLTQTIQDKNNYLPNIYMKSFMNAGFLSIFLNISGVFIVQQILINLFSNKNINTRNDMIMAATARAFAIVMMATPLELIVVVSIDYSGIGYLTLLPWLFIISFIMFLIEIISSRKTFGDVKVDLPYTEIDNKKLFKSLAQMLVILIIFITTVVLLNNYTELSFILSIGLTLLPFSFIVSLVLRFPRRFLREGFTSWQHHNNNLQNFVVLFLPLGIFSSSFSNSTVPAWISSKFGEVEIYTIFIFLIAAAFITVTALIGIHAVAGVAILLDILMPVVDEAALLSLMVVIIASGLATTAYSPYSTITNVTIQNIKVSPSTILRRNKWFALRMMTIAIIVASLMMLI
ncbi:hypothetical protein [Aliicoccus persicus]|uniref:Uncharacterized protein n=1 Tax=Aliicoccus persicus TaxID=930138 RepID=A0A662Z633_9STAP|nr:hypothetical protein [Aliicoccus persicus]SEW12374.1 hypothetical protein SAMN05192557_1742 [Aliicoccus persicus]